MLSGCRIIMFHHFVFLIELQFKNYLLRLTTIWSTLSKDFQILSKKRYDLLSTKSRKQK